MIHSGPSDESDFDLYLLDADGTGLTPLLTGPANDAFPQFCDEDTVVFERRSSATEADVYAIQADGTGLRGLLSIYELPLTSQAARGQADPTLIVSPGTDPDYSPNGTRLAFAAPPSSTARASSLGADPGDGTTGIYEIDPRTNTITHQSPSPSPGVSRLPRYLPDGAGLTG